MKKSLTAKSAIASVLLVGAAAGTTLIAAPANADIDRLGSCAGAMYEFSVDRNEGGGYEVSIDVDNARPGSSWRAAIRHNGRLLAARTLRADAEGELELSTFKINRAGADRFKMVLTPAGGSACTKLITVR